MAINGFVLNGHQLDGRVEKNTGSGAILGIGQDVAYHFVGSGAIISIENNVTTTASGAIINICQDVQL